MKKNLYVFKEAVFSEDRKYRYYLSRIWDMKKPCVMFIMLNPSTADEDKDDSTIRRCVGYAKSWGFGAIYVCNLFAYCSSNPQDLFIPSNPIGSLNVKYLLTLSISADKIIIGWGNRHILKRLNKKFPDYVKQILILFKSSTYYLHLLKDGTPAHPLYLKKDLVPMKM